MEDQLGFLECFQYHPFEHANQSLLILNYLEEEVSRMHSHEKEGMGEGRTDGSSRALMMKEAEKLRAAAMEKSLKELPDQSERAVLVRKNTDKLSTAFLLAKPGPHSAIPAIFFSEQLCALLAVPSVLCRGKEGERVGRLTVDKWGDAIMNATLQGGHFLKGHNMMKNTLKSLFKYCGIN